MQEKERSRSSRQAIHHRIFQDVYEWAGGLRIVNIEKIETVLNGICVEYSDVFDIEKDASKYRKRKLSSVT